MTTDETIQKIMRAYRSTFDKWTGRSQWIGVHEPRDTLPKLFHELGYKDGVEVGTQRGLFSVRLCTGCPGLHLTCVDPWSSFGRSGQYKQNIHFESATRKLAPFSATILRMMSMQALEYFADLSIDFVFIDGDHTFDYVCPDLIFWSRKVKKGGIVALHDYSNWYEVGVMQAVDAYTLCHGIFPKYVNFEQSPTVFWVKP